MKAVTQSLAFKSYPFFIRFLLAARVRKIYILKLDFLITLQPKQSSPLKQSFSFKKNLQRSRHKNQECSHYFFSSPTFFLLRFFYFPFPRSFLGGFSGSFCPRLLVFFSVKRRFSFGMFSNIQRDNTLAFTVTYTLIFVNVLTSSNIQVSLF